MTETRSCDSCCLHKALVAPVSLPHSLQTPWQDVGSWPRSAPRPGTQPVPRRVWPSSLCPCPYALPCRTPACRGLFHGKIEIRGTHRREEPKAGPALQPRWRRPGGPDSGHGAEETRLAFCGRAPKVGDRKRRRWRQWGQHQFGSPGGGVAEGSKQTQEEVRSPRCTLGHAAAADFKGAESPRAEG